MSGFNLFIRKGRRFGKGCCVKMLGLGALFGRVEGEAVGLLLGAGQLGLWVGEMERADVDGEREGGLYVPGGMEER